MKHISLSLFIGAFMQFILINNVFSQEEKRDVIQFSGVVSNQDTVSGIMGAHVYVPKGGRGTTTNYYGYFSFPVLEGDSVVISAVGFEKASIIIPEVEADSYTAIIAMREDTTYLPELEILPFPTEEMFKEAVLAYQLPNQGDLNNMDRNLDPVTLLEMARATPMDGSLNHRFFMQQQAVYLHDAYGPRYNPLLNPFAWADFFKSLKKKKK
ncbi:MAG: carboxypeptidase-like regulatory domain-containing protein [Cytophagales bacterium]|nr:carboxypeptidase-like regulatory domain-containing protein [Cytophagales bacterium]